MTKGIARIIIEPFPFRFRSIIGVILDFTWYITVLSLDSLPTKFALAKVAKMAKFLILFLSDLFLFWLSLFLFCLQREQVYYFPPFTEDEFLLMFIAFVLQ